MELPAEKKQAIQYNQEKNKRSNLSNNFDPSMYVNQQLPAIKERNIMKMMVPTTSKSQFQLDDNKYGKLRVRNDSSFKRGFVRNDFLGQEYRDVVSQMQSIDSDMPVGVSAQIPINMKEQALYPRNNSSNQETFRS